MKRYIFAIIILLTSTNLSAKSREVLKDGTVVINTTEIASDIKGYKDITPIELHLKNGVVRKVKLLPNNESADIFKRVIDGCLSDRWSGIKVDDISNTDVDIISGATLSSRAIIANVKRAAEYEIKVSK